MAASGQPGGRSRAGLGGNSGQGERWLFKHLGRLEDVDIAKYQFNDFQAPNIMLHAQRLMHCFQVKTGQASQVLK